MKMNSKKSSLRTWRMNTLISVPPALSRAIRIKLNKKEASKARKTYHLTINLSHKQSFLMWSRAKYTSILRY